MPLALSRGRSLPDPPLRPRYEDSAAPQRRGFTNVGWISCDTVDMDNPVWIKLMHACELKEREGGSVTIGDPDVVNHHGIRISTASPVVVAPLGDKKTFRFKFEVVNHHAMYGSYSVEAIAKARETLPIPCPSTSVGSTLHQPPVRPAQAPTPSAPPAGWPRAADNPIPAEVQPRAGQSSSGGQGHRL